MILMKLLIQTIPQEEALSALEVLGINKKSAGKLVDKIIKDNLDITVEEIIKETLKNI